MMSYIQVRNGPSKPVATTFPVSVCLSDHNSTELPGYQVVAKHHSCDKLSGVNCDRETMQWKVNIQKSIAPPKYT